MALFSNAKVQQAIERVCEKFKVLSLDSEQGECIKAILQEKMCMQVYLQDMGSLIFYAAPIVADEVFKQPHGGSKIIISPLETLMKDQVSYLKSLRVSAITLHGKQAETILKDVEKGRFRYMFASPEKMLNIGGFKWRLPLMRCTVSVSGVYQNHSNLTAVPFRTWYANLGELRSLTSEVPSIVLTATACTSTRRDIFKTLNLKEPSCHIV